jgi:hypothetical protein
MDAVGYQAIAIAVGLAEPPREGETYTVLCVYY